MLNQNQRIIFIRSKLKLTEFISIIVSEAYELYWMIILFGKFKNGQPYYKISVRTEWVADSRHKVFSQWVMEEIVIYFVCKYQRIYFSVANVCSGFLLISVC